MESKIFSFKAIARIKKRRKKGMFGLVFEVPKFLIEYTDSAFWLVYGNSCFYCNSTEDINRICREHDGVVIFFKKI